MQYTFIRRVVAGTVLITSNLILPFLASAQYTNGIYAEFNTSMGSYTCALYYAQAPKAVANFIGLATGQRAWLDLTSGLVSTNPFYNGLTFHRVVAGFMNQSGSRNALGTDGPGYAVTDEFNPSLRHDDFGALSMANSGPDSNGSQYFITVEPAPWLNDNYTMFGKLYGGSNVVAAINNVACDANFKPLTNVVMQSVIIQRIGAAAQAFDITSQGLPVVTNLSFKLASPIGTNITLAFSNNLYVDNQLFISSNLTSWVGKSLGIEVAPPLTNSTTQSAVAAAQFYRAGQIHYPSSTFAPKTVYGRTITMVFTQGYPGTNVFVFDSAGSGTFTFTGYPPDTIRSYVWNQKAYNGIIPLIFFNSVLPPTQLDLNYKTATTGNISGTGYPYFPFSYGAVQVTGTFTSSP